MKALILQMNNKKAAEEEKAFRCPCHNRAFTSKQEYQNHMNPCSFRCGIDDYQAWMEDLDVETALPKVPDYLPLSIEAEALRKKRKRARQEQRFKAARSGQQHGDAPMGSPRSARGDASDRNTTPSVDGSAMRTALKGQGSPAHASTYAWFRARLASLDSTDVDYPDIIHGIEYLLVYGTTEELKPQFTVLNRIAYYKVKRVFDLVTRNGSHLTMADLADVGEALGKKYKPSAFKKIDRDRSNAIDFTEVLKAFFPAIGRKQLMKLYVEHAKPLPASVRESVRDRLGPSQIDELDSMFQLYSRGKDHVTLSDLLSFMSDTTQEHPDVVIECFKRKDIDGDGVLNLIEFSELMQYTVTTPDGRDISGSMGASSFANAAAANTGRVGFVGESREGRRGGGGGGGGHQSSLSAGEKRSDEETPQTPETPISLFGLTEAGNSRAAVSKRQHNNQTYQGTAAENARHFMNLPVLAMAVGDYKSRTGKRFELEVIQSRNRKRKQRMANGGDAGDDIDDDVDEDLKQVAQLLHISPPPPRNTTADAVSLPPISPSNGSVTARSTNTSRALRSPRAAAASSRLAGRGKGSGASTARV